MMKLDREAKLPQPAPSATPVPSTPPAPSTPRRSDRAKTKKEKAEPAAEPAKRRHAKKGKRRAQTEEESEEEEEEEQEEEDVEHKKKEKGVHKKQKPDDEKMSEAPPRPQREDTRTVAQWLVAHGSDIPMPQLEAELELYHANPSGRSPCTIRFNLVPGTLPVSEPPRSDRPEREDSHSVAQWLVAHGTSVPMAQLEAELDLFHQANPSGLLCALRDQPLWQERQGLPLRLWQVGGVDRHRHIQSLTSSARC
jgi:hypothetical protein